MRVFPRNFECLTRSPSVSINSIETRKKCFLFPLLNSLLKTLITLIQIFFYFVQNSTFFDNQFTKISSLYVCMVNIKLKYNFVETPRKFIIAFQFTKIKTYFNTCRFRDKVQQKYVVLEYFCQVSPFCCILYW